MFCECVCVCNWVSVTVQVRASAALELGQVVKEVRRQVEKEKEIAINETKKKKWVRDNVCVTLNC